MTAEKRKATNPAQTGKKAKSLVEDNTPSSFEEEMMLMDAISQESQQSTASINSTTSNNPRKCSERLTSRPPLPQLDPKKDAIIFQQIEMDFYTGMCMYLFVFDRK